MVKTRLTDLDSVPERGSWLFTVRDSGAAEEVILVRCADERGPVRAYKNFCQHETDQRLDRGLENGAAVREDGIVCPKHGSMFDTCSGHCDNGEAAGSTLVAVDVEVEEGEVYLTDDSVSFRHRGGIEDDDDMPGSTSHLGF
jgi:nitrite reductase/ring-hydroxylating ferredoxin subunit